MIELYSDPAANERTFFAWVRAAIAATAFGLLIAQCDLFIRFAAPQVASAFQAIADHRFAGLGGPSFFLLGMALLVLLGRKLPLYTPHVVRGLR
jgi:uncharacterized membrane protein YidH (DUF202 family)